MDNKRLLDDKPKLIVYIPDSNKKNKTIFKGIIEGVNSVGIEIKTEKKKDSKWDGNVIPYHKIISIKYSK